MYQRLISVIMGIYNCEKTLARAIESIINQTYDNWELIICDDGSDDKSPIIVEQYRSLYPEKITLIHNKHNCGLAVSLNKCLSVARGEFIARMDADDESLPERFEKQLNFLDNHKRVILCGTSFFRINELNGNKRIEKSIPKPNCRTMFYQTPFYHPTIMCYRKIFDDLKYSEKQSVVRCEDLELWYNFFEKKYNGANLKEPLYNYYENYDSVFRINFQSRWNTMITHFKGYKLLHYPFYLYYKPIIDFCKILVPRKILIWYKFKFIYRRE